MVAIDWHLLVVQALSFLITVWILTRFAWKPIQGMLAGRENEVRSDYERAEQARREAEEMSRQYRERIAQAESEGRERINTAIQRAKQQEEQILESARQESQLILERGRAEIDRERQKVMAELRQQVTHLSVAIAGKILDEQLDENRQRRLVDDFIDRLGTVA